MFRRTDQRVQGRRTLFYDRMRPPLPPTLPAHLWKGILTPDKAQAIAMHGDDVVGTRHRYGKGEAVWLPSLIELGGWHGDNKGVADFYGTYCRGQIDRAPLGPSANSICFLPMLPYVAGCFRRSQCL